MQLRTYMVTDWFAKCRFCGRYSPVANNLGAANHAALQAKWTYNEAHDTWTCPDNHEYLFDYWRECGRLALAVKAP